MIHINLLPGSRASATRFGAMDFGRRVTVACGVILLITVLVIGWRFWSLRQSDAQLTLELAAADAELQRLAPVLESLATLERQRTRLAERVDLVEALRDAQAGPVRMLDQISRSLPDGLWLSELRQSEDGVVVQGRAMTLIALSDFVANLESSGQVTPPVEIIGSQTEETPQGEVVRFELRARSAGRRGDPPR